MHFFGLYCINDIAMHGAININKEQFYLLGDRVGQSINGLDTGYMVRELNLGGQERFSVSV